LKEVRVYILTHQGQRDVKYEHPTSAMRAGEKIGTDVYGRDFDLTAIPNWQQYRWKVYPLIVRVLL
jgi:hypothetical protein